MMVHTKAALPTTVRFATFAWHSVLLCSPYWEYGMVPVVVMIDVGGPSSSSPDNKRERGMQVERPRGVIRSLAVGLFITPSCCLG